MSAVLDEAVETLRRLEDDAARRAYLDARPELLQRTFVEQLVDAARHHLHIDRLRSRALAAAAEAIASRIGDDRLLARSLRAHANALWASRANTEAVEHHARALRAFEAVGDEAEIARTLSASIQPLIFLGRYAEALAAAERARELFTRAGDELRLARLAVHVGNIFHRQDRFEEALACYERARERLRALGDIEGIVSSIHNEAVTLTSLLRFPEALASYAAARELAVEHRMPLAVVQTDYNSAWLYFLRGEYTRAIDLLYANAEVSRQQDDRYHSALCQLDLSEIYLELGLNTDAGEIAEQAQAMFRDLGMGYEAAKALTNTALAYGREGSLARALELFDEARKLFVREQNHAWPSLIDLYRAVLLFQDGRLDEAEPLCEAALRFLDNSALVTKAALCRLLRARIDLRRGDFDSAQRACDKAIQQVAEIDTPAVRYEAHLVQGHVYAARGDRANAACAFDAARRDIETLRRGIRGDELKIAFVRNKLELYETLVAMCLEDGAPGQVEQAFSYVEQAKCRSLLDLLAHPVHALADCAADEPPNPTARRIRELRQDLNSYYHLLEAEQLDETRQSAERLQHLETGIRSREKELTQQLRQLSASDAQQIDRHASPLSLQEIREALPQNARLLEYFQVGDRLLVWIVGRDDMQVVPVGPAREVENSIRRLHFQLGKFQVGETYVHTFESLLLESTQAHLQNLHGQLLGPVWNAIRGLHLVVIPHRFLHYVPFHALFDGREYVIDSCTVSYAPSASVYALADRQAAVEARRSLVLAVPDDRAPLMEAEARAVAAALPDPTLHVGDTATVRTLQALGPSSRVVHIASHGRFRRDNPMFSAIRLGDGYLNVYDLYQLRLPAALITLSGCATGQTVAAAGDEILGISRGLLCAGARSLLLSLWDVHDEGTTEFMTSFYRKLQAEDIATALRAAMREARTHHPHPYYWAPFALLGKFLAA